MITKNQYAEARKLTHAMKAPVRGFVVDTVVYPGHLALRIYENQIGTYSTDQKVALAEHLYKLRDAIRLIGVGCEIEGVKGDPPRLAS